MPCRSSRKQYLEPGGRWTFNPDAGFGPQFYRELMCGVCRDCRVRTARDWSTRCYHEAKLHTRNCWIHPTYAVDPVQVHRRDFQILFKRLRKRGHRFSYFGAAEYGERFSRPHGHIVLFGTDFPDAYPWRKSNGFQLYRSPELESVWTWGHIEIGEVTASASQYTAGYVQKKINGPMAEDHYQREYNGQIVQVNPEFGMQSKNPAIGKRWIEKNWREVYPCDFVVVNGKQRPVPRYYDKWLAEHEPDAWNEVRQKRMEFAQSRERETDERRRQAGEARDHFYGQLERSYEGGH